MSLLTPEEKASRRQAYVAVRKALRAGTLVRGASCEACQPLDGHHRFGYQRPLDVVWLCAMHHGQEHYELRRGATIADDGGLVPFRPDTDESWIAYHEFLLAEADRRIVTSKRELTVLRRRVTRRKNIAARNAAARNAMVRA